MNLNDAWNKFISDGTVASYLEYSKIKDFQEAKNAVSNAGTDNKGDGYKG